MKSNIKIRHNKKYHRVGFKQKIEHIIHKKNIFLELDRTIARSAGWQLAIVLGLFLVIFSVVCILYRHENYSAGKAFIDLTSSGTFNNEVYETVTKTIDAKQYDGPTYITIPVKSTHPWRSAIIYLLGSVVFSGLSIATLTNALGTRADRFIQGKVRYRNFRGHIVILGYNDMVPRMIERLFADPDGPNRIIIGVKMDVQKITDQILETIKLSNKSKENIKLKKYILVLEADSNNEWDLKKRMLVHRAKEVYILGEHDDASNLYSYEIIQHLCNKQHSHPECYVHMQYQSTFALFQRYQNTEYFHAFNFHDTLARKIITKYRKIDYRDKGQINLGPDSFKYVHLVIVGMTEMGEALAREAAFRCHYPNYVKKQVRTRITFIDQEAKKYMTYFTGRYNHLFNLCHYTFRNISDNIMETHQPDKDFLDIEFEFIQANVADNEVQNELSKWAMDESQVLTIAICAELPHRSMATGLYLPDEIFDPDKKIPVWIYQPAKGNMVKYFKGSYYRFKNVITFGTSGNELDIKNEKFVKQAMYLNHFYIQHQEKDENIPYIENDIEYEWNNTVISEKWSNIYNVSTIKTKLRSIGGLDKLSENVELLAEVEHNRWNVEKLLMGFRPTNELEHSKISGDGHINTYLKNLYIEQRFAHDDIRPFSEINEASKDIQRDYIREIPKIINWR